MTYVDERVVELRFDNKQFEQETARSMSTLDKLKEKLQFKNAQSGAEQLQKAVANINVNPIVQGIDTLETKMSTLGIAGKRVIENLVDWGMSGIHKLEQKLQGPINQIINGGKSRAQNIEQAKFQLEGLHVAWEDIEGDINYGVQDTAYGLDAAAKVASQLVASQVELGDEMKHALLGISGVAAMTSSTYEDVGRIYTTVAGNGRLMGEQLLQLSTRGINAAATLGEALNLTEAEVRNMVSKGKISFEMFSEAMFKAFGEHAKSANKTFQGALSNTKAALSRLGADVAAQGFNSIRDILNDIIPKLKEFKNKMKPAEESIIKMTEAIGKLVQTFIRSIDIEAIVNRLSPVIQKAANFLGDFAEAYERIFAKRHGMDSIFDPEKKGMEELGETTETVTTAMEHLYEITDKQKEMAWDIWNLGKYGTGQDRVAALKDDYDIVQAYIEKMIELGWDEAKMNEFLAKQVEDHEKQLDEANHSNKKNTFAENLARILDNLRRVISNVASSISNVLAVAFSAFDDSFNGDGVSGALVIFTDKLADLSDNLKITKERAEKLRPGFKALFTVLEYAGKALKFVATAIYKAIGNLDKLIAKAKESKTVRKIFESIQFAASKIVETITSLYDRIKKSESWHKFIDILKTVVNFLGEKLADAFTFIGDIISNIGDGAETVFTKVVDKIKDLKDNAENGYPWLQKIKGFFTEDLLHGSWLTKLKELLESIFGKGKDVFKSAFDKGSDFINGLISGLKNISVEDIETIAKIVGVIATIVASVRWLWSMGNVNNALSKFTGSLGETFEALTSMINKYGKRADAQRFQAFGTTVAIIVGSMIALIAAIAAMEYLKLDSSRIITMAGTIVVLLTAIIGAAAVLVSYFRKADNIEQMNKSLSILPNLKIPALAATLFSIGYMMQSLIRSMVTLYNIMTSSDFSVASFLFSAGIIVTLLVSVGIITGVLLSMTKNNAKIAGVAGMLFTTAILISSLVNAFKKMIKITKGVDFITVGHAAGILELLLLTIFGFAIAVMAISSKFPTNSNIISNPFKGMFGMFVGLAVLIRLALVPLIGTMAAAYKEGVSGVLAIEKLQGIMFILLGFVTVITLISSILSSTITTNKFSMSGGSGPFWGIAAIVASLALVFYTISKALSTLKGIDNSTLVVFMGFVSVIMFLATALSALVGVISIFTGPIITTALFAVASVIASVGIAFLGAGYGFKAFEEGLVHLVENLPMVIDNLMVFFQKVEDNAETIKNGIANTIMLFIESATLGVAAGIYAMQETIPTIAEALVVTVVNSINSLADTIFEHGDDFVDAVHRLTGAFAYVLAYAAEATQEKTGEIVGGLIWGVVEQNLQSLPGGSKIGKSDFVADDIRKDLELKYGKTGAKLATSGYGALREAYEKTMRGIATVGDSEVGDKIAYDSFFGYDGFKVDESAIEDRLTSWFDGMDLDRYKKGAQELLNDEKIQSFISQQFNGFNPMGSTDDSAFGDWFNNAGFSWGEGSIEGYIQAVEEGGPEAGQAYLDTFTNINTITEDQAEIMADLGAENMDQYIVSVQEKKDPTVLAFKNILDTVANLIASYEPEFYKLGMRLHEGFSMGLVDKDPMEMTIYNVADLVRRAQLSLCKEAEIKSPSRVFMRLGEFVTMGFAQGITNLSYAAETATQDVGESSMNSLRSIIDRIYNTTMDDMDTSPRITPVLDLSEVESGISTMGGMFNGNNSFGLAFGARNGFNENLAARNLAMNVQNDYDGTNVVDAINGLRQDITGLQEAMNNMGFYVDGRQMAKAIANPMNDELNDISLRTGRGVS